MIGSFCPDVCGFDDRRPSRDVALHQRGERALTPFCFVRDIGAKLKQALARVLIIKRLIQSVG
jgi:hypothetical protein